MSISAVKVLGITLGDPAGIGPEVTSKALAKISLRGRSKFLVIGDESSFKRYFSRLPKGVEYCVVPANARFRYSLGKPTPHSGDLSFRFLQKSVDLLKNGAITAVVTAPLSKESVCHFQPGFVGHTEYFAQAFHVKKFDMMFVTDKFKTAIVTRHVSIGDVPKLITRQKVFDTIVLVNDALKKHFKMNRPRIAVCGLNPHAGEGGKIGREELKEIIPAIQMAAKIGIKVAGPFAADTLFVPQRRQGFDVIVSMYHDQGLIAIKTLFFNSVVNLTIGLPFVRTSPAHGTAFDIAGKNKADASSMSKAIELALKLSSVFAGDQGFPATPDFTKQVVRPMNPAKLPTKILGA